MKPDLKQLENYGYTFDREVKGIAKGTVLTLRRMSEDKRDEFLKLRCPALFLLTTRFWDHLIDEKVDPDEWDRLHKQFIKTLKPLVVKECVETWKILVENSLPGSHAQILERVMVVEASLSVGEGVPEQILLPDPSEVDNMNEEEVETTVIEAQRLGGPSPAKSLPMTTGPTPQPEEESKSGQESKVSDK